MNYEEFKERINSNGFGWQSRSYKEVISFISSIYSEENILGFYPKNLVNDKQKGFLYILKGNKIVQALAEVDDNDNFTFNYEENLSGIHTKELMTSKYPHLDHQLTIKFNNGEEIILHNREDSNMHWSEEYTEYILNIYKSI